MILAISRAIEHRRASTTVVFAAFAAALTLGVLMLGNSAGSKMLASLNKSPPIRY